MPRTRRNSVAAVGVGSLPVASVASDIVLEPRADASEPVDRVVRETLLARRRLTFCDGAVECT